MLNNSRATIFILSSCESERHLTEQLKKELERLNFNSIYIPLTQNSIVDSYKTTEYFIRTYKPHLVLAVADRTEQIGGVLAAFQNKIPVAHLYAGDMNPNLTTFDEIHRHTITLYSQIQFCSSKESMINTNGIMKSAGLNPNSYVVGATHFDGIDLKEIKENLYGLKTRIPYTLILINSETLGWDNKLIEDAVSSYYSGKRKYNSNIIIAKGNNDNENIETSIFTKTMKLTNGDISIVRENRQYHKFFLSLISHCERFITNSSSSIYEAPLLIDERKIIHIGNRNKERTKVPKEAHDGLASKRIALHIEDFLEAKI